MALEYYPDKTKIETRYVTNAVPPPRNYESKIKKYVRVAGKVAAIIGTLVGIGRFLFGDAMIVEQKKEQPLEELVDSLILLEPSNEQDTD
jgi:hypothetical protein